jgi:uncharacterized lipoprotein YehR (DUF1307 family)
LCGLQKLFGGILKMKKIAKCLMMVVLVAAMVVPLVGCGGGDSLVGEWSAGRDFSIVFSENGEFRMNDAGFRYEGTWRSRGNGVLELTYDYYDYQERWNYEINVNNTELVITFEEGGRLILIRQR